jgi:hypothetical protein
MGKETHGYMHEYLFTETELLDHGIMATSHCCFHAQETGTEQLPVVGGLPTPCVLTPKPQFLILNPTQVNHLLLEFLNKYVAEVVSDATSFQEHASKPELDTDDIRCGNRAFHTHDSSETL